MIVRRPLALAVLWLAFAPRAALAEDGVVLAAGDIAGRGRGKELTAKILDANPTGIVLTLGDNAYNAGTLSQFDSLYRPTWGRHVARTFPSVGNHDYDTPGGKGYDTFFRSRVGHPIGDRGKHWYSFDYAGWHFVALNSNCKEVSCGAGGEQATWFDADLSAHDVDCALVFWHHPRFSSGVAHGSSIATQALYEVAHRHGVDLILSGHDHDYERFAPQDAYGKADPTGPTEFVVGTGGGAPRGMGPLEPNSVTSAGKVFGVLRLTLHPQSYEWKFLPADGYAYSDAGSASCVGPRSSP